MVIEKETSYVDAQEAARMLGVIQRAVRNLWPECSLGFGRARAQFRCCCVGGVSSPDERSNRPRSRAQT